jgi:hypothetical protein
MAGRVPLENVNERKKKQNECTRFGRRLLIFESNRLSEKLTSREKLRDNA